MVCLLISIQFLRNVTGKLEGGRWEKEKRRKKIEAK